MKEIETTLCSRGTTHHCSANRPGYLAWVLLHQGANLKLDYDDIVSVKNIIYLLPTISSTSQSAMVNDCHVASELVHQLERSEEEDGGEQLPSSPEKSSMLTAG
jgi:hypothetical protein